MDGKPTILGVDDSLTIRKALEIVLKPAGYELELANDGAGAIEKARSLRPSLILLDFILPDMHGTEVCRQLAGNPETANIPVVLISAKGAEIQQAYRDVGNVVSYIPKPFKPQIVTSTVAEILARSAAGELVKLTVATEATESESGALPAAAPTPPPVSETGFDVPLDLASDLAAPARGNGHDAGEDIDDEDVVELEGAAESTARLRRQLLDSMFETLRSGLEGVYVEEVDTPTGAAADQAKSYTDLIEQISRQLEESLRHARSGARHTLYSDGSLRSLDETLLDAFHRSCRLLFRAATAGAVGNDAAASPLRILVACHRDGRVHEQLRSMLDAHPSWQVVVVAERFRQLPMLARLYAPTHVIAEVTWTGALWDQLSLLQRLPEARRMSVVGIAEPERLSSSDSVDRDSLANSLAERGIGQVLDSALDIEAALDADSAHDEVSAAGTAGVAELQVSP